MATKKKPVFFELAGLPAAGKTTAAALLIMKLADRGIPASIVPESVNRSPLANSKLDWRLNTWSLLEAVLSVLKACEEERHEVVILDRGIVDALCWFEWHRKRGTLTTGKADIRWKLATEDTWLSRLSAVFLLRTSYRVAIQRVGRTGRVVNPQTHSQLASSYEAVLTRLKRTRRGPVVHTLETDFMSPQEVVDWLLGHVMEILPSRQQVGELVTLEACTEAAAGLAQVLDRNPSDPAATANWRVTLSELGGMLRSAAGFLGHLSPTQAEDVVKAYALTRGDKAKQLLAQTTETGDLLLKAQAYEALADLYISMNLPGRAIESYHMATSLYDTATRYRDCEQLRLARTDIALKIGLTRADQGDYEEALICLRQAAESYGSTAFDSPCHPAASIRQGWLRQAIGLVLLSLGRHQEARAEFKASYESSLAAIPNMGVNCGEHVSVGRTNAANDRVGSKPD